MLLWDEGINHRRARRGSSWVCSGEIEWEGKRIKGRAIYLNS